MRLRVKVGWSFTCRDIRSSTVNSQRSPPAAHGAHLGLGSNKPWQQCDDWTENRQASSALIHKIVGRTTALEHALAPFLPQEHKDTDGDADETLEKGAAMHHRMSASSCRSSDASGPTVATIHSFIALRAPFSSATICLSRSVWSAVKCAVMPLSP